MRRIDHLARVVGLILAILLSGCTIDRRDEPSTPAQEWRAPATP